MTKTEIVPLTPELANRFYEHAPTKTIHGFAAVRGDRVLGIAGMYTHDAKRILFSELSDELKKDRRAIVRGIRALLGYMRKTKMPVYSVINESIEGADVLLRHVGFVPEAEGLYRWHS